VSPRVLIAIIVVLLSWASAFIVIRGVAPHFGGGGLALGRLIVGTVLLSFLLIGKKWVQPNGREWWLIIGFGVLWFGAYNVALNIAEQTVDAGTAAMIVGMGPILIALGAGLFLGEGIPKWLAIGAGVAFLGAVLIGVGTGGAIGLDGGVGVLWAILAALTYAAGVLLQKPALKRIPNAQVTWMGAAIGLVSCLPFAGELLRDIQTAPVEGILGLVYLGAVPTALAFSLWAYALYRMPAGQLGVTTYIVPPLTVVAGLLVFAEIPTILAIIGGALCLVGVALSRRKKRIPQPAATLAE
jgi:drug/metabolite transporter (DMT)-like permease